MSSAGSACRAAGDSCYLGNQRSYDAWGGVRAGSATGEPNARHVANLGHLTDDESGLVYMRARYYDPWSGRFLAEDPRREGLNWFAFGDNDPINLVDARGTSAEEDNFIGNVLVMIGAFLLGNGSSPFKELNKWARRKVATKLITEILARGIEKPIAKLLVTMIDIYLKSSSLTRINVGTRMAGYMLVLLGQLFLTESEFEGGGGDWWGYGAVDNPFFPK